MAQAHTYTVAGDPRRAFATAVDVLQEHGFRIGPEKTPYVVQAEHGSKGATFAAGAWAGKDAQHLKAEVKGFEHGGSFVIQFTPGSTGVMAGAIGVSRANTAYADLARAIADRFYRAGVLTATTVQAG